MRWHDVRDVEFISLDPAACFGLIVNVRNRSPAWPLSVLFKERRHWFALRCISGVWYNLDSKLREPQRLTGNAGHDVGPRDESAGTSAPAGGETTAVVLREYLSQLAANNDAIMKQQQQHQQQQMIIDANNNNASRNNTPLMQLLVSNESMLKPTVSMSK